MRPASLHAIHRVTGFEVVGPATLRVEFADGVERTIDFSAVLRGELYGPLRDPALFARVEIDPESRTLVWPNEADFDPGTLHDWPDAVRELEARAASWAEPPSGG